MLNHASTSATLLCKVAAAVAVVAAKAASGKEVVASGKGATARTLDF